MGLEPQEFTETKLTAKKFTEQACETGTAASTAHHTRENGGFRILFQRKFYSFLQEF